MDLAGLSRTILILIKKPVSKVRLARLVYFIHKDLIRKKLMKPEDISYVRSPLGPTPEGFIELADEETGIVAQKNVSSSLSYTSEDYAIEDLENSEEELLEQYREVLAVVEQNLEVLKHYTTPELINFSHKEPSWLAHSNGEIYRITSADLKVNLPNNNPIVSFINTIPGLPGNSTPVTNKSGAMQANLLKGMITDIVKESTDLEYPDSDATKYPPRTKPKKPFSLISIEKIQSINPLNRLPFFRKNSEEEAKKPKNDHSTPDNLDEKGHHG